MDRSSYLKEEILSVLRTCSKSCFKLRPLTAASCKKLVEVMIIVVKNSTIGAQGARNTKVSELFNRVEVSPPFNAKLCKISGEFGKLRKISGECGKNT